MRYTRNEIRALHSMLVYLAEEEEMSTIRSNNNAFIYPTQIFNILNQLGIITSTSDFPVGRIDFDSFVEIIQTSHSEDDDECHLRFLCIVNEYQLRCDSAGKYLLAQVFLDHLVCLSKEEENRRVDEVKNMLADDREKIIEAHERQQNEFSRKWDEYLARFHLKSEQYMAEMQLTHKQQLDSFRERITHEIENRPKKWSRDLMECRKSLENVAKQASTGRHTQLYHEAQRIKQVTDALHEKEGADMKSKFNGVLSAKVRNLEKNHHSEKAVLMKRIHTFHRELTKKRHDDTLKLVQRNRNIVKMLIAKDQLECSRVASEIRQHIKRVLKERCKANSL